MPRPGVGSNLKVMRRLLRRGVARFFAQETMVILRRETPARPVCHEDCAVLEYAASDPRVAQLYLTYDRGFAPERLKRRFELGLRFYELVKQGETLGTTWLVVDAERFIDEVAIGFRPETGALWLRDIFIAPEHRGRDLFRVFLDCLLARFYPGSPALWSDVRGDNEASLRAHTKYGFVRQKTYRVVHLFGILLLRLHWPTDPRISMAFEPRRRVVWTRRPYREFVEARRQ